MSWQSDNIYNLRESDVFQFMQAFCRYILKHELENDGLHPERDKRDRWMCIYLKTHFKDRIVKKSKDSINNN